MGGLTIGGNGNGVVVVEAELQAAIHRLGIAAAELGMQRTVLDGQLAEWRLAGLRSSPPGVAHAVSSMESARDLLGAAQQRTSALVAALRFAAVSYAAAETLATAAVTFAKEAEAWTLGVAARVFGGPMLLGLGADLGLLCLVTRKSPADLAGIAGGLVMQHPGVITSPEFVGGVGTVVDNMDQFEDGLLGMPPGMSELLGPHGLGLTGPATAAASVVAAASVFGLFRETPVRVRKSEVVDHASPPITLEDRMDLIPSATKESPAQVRIIRYHEAHGPDRFDVFFGGTASFDPHATTQPFDLTSDVTGVAHQDPGAYRAAVEAMRQAGVTSHTPIVVSGYSEGGLIASLVASSGHYDVKGVLTMGSPSGQVPIADSIPVLTVRHTDDLVPATGGFDANTHEVLVQRRAFEPGDAIPTDKPVPAHQRDPYLQTLRMADASNDPRLVAAMDRLNNFGAGATSADSTLWVATREQ